MRPQQLTILVLAMWACAAVATAQPVPATPPAPRTPSTSTRPAAMTNADVIKLVRAGLNDSLIAVGIRQAKATKFDITADGLVALKTAGVSDFVIAVMLDPTAPPAPPPAAVASPVSGVAAVSPAKEAAPAGDPFAVPRDPGIYLDTGGGPDTLVVLEPSVFSQAKSGGILTSAMTYGLYKAKLKAVVRSPKANIRTPQQRPTFYFYFENRSASPGGGFAGSAASATSPNEVVLAQMVAKRDSRELVVGEFGATGTSTGARTEDTVPLTIQKLAPGVYRVVPSEDLGRGEFCFFFASGAGAIGAGAAGKLFDFGVDERK